MHFTVGRPWSVVGQTPKAPSCPPVPSRRRVYVCIHISISESSSSNWNVEQVTWAGAQKMIRFLDSDHINIYYPTFSAIHSLVFTQSEDSSTTAHQGNVRPHSYVSRGAACPTSSGHHSLHQSLSKANLLPWAGRCQ